VTLGRIFSCFHDRDHVHPHIYANSYTGSYAKHAIHPPKIYFKVQRDFSCILAKGERGHRKKESICSRSIEKNCAPIKEHKKKEKESMTPLQNKSKRRISKQGLFRKTKKYSTHLHISIMLHD
jgi:hypothetical protein